MAVMHNLIAHIEVEREYYDQLESKQLPKI